MSHSPNKLAFSGRAAALLAASIGLALAGTGCFFTQSSTSSGTGGATPEVTVQTDAKLTVTAGALQGVFVQYAKGGFWNVYTSCDTVADGNSCSFDITLSTSDAKGISATTGTNQGPNDTITTESDGSLHLLFQPTSALDGVTFTTTAGAVLEVDANLNGAPAPKLVNWISSGAVQNGMPSNPCDFTPSAP